MANQAKDFPIDRVGWQKVKWSMGFVCYMVLSYFGVMAMLRFFVLVIKPKTVYDLCVNNKYSFPLNVLVRNDYDDFRPDPEKLGTVPANGNVTFYYALVKPCDYDFVFRDQQGHTVFRVSTSGKNISQAVINNLYSITIGPQSKLAEHIETSKPGRVTHGGNGTAHQTRENLHPLRDNVKERVP